MTQEELWQAVLAQIQLTISPANFATWFRDTAISSIKDGIVFISVPNSFVKEWLEQKYHKTIFKILHNLNEEIKEVKYQLTKPVTQTIKQSFVSFKETTGQLEFSEFEVDKETNLNPRYTFSNFVVGPCNELSQAAAWAVAENPGKVYNPLFIYGGVGLGKTHLLQAVGNEIIKNSRPKKVKYLQAEKFVSAVISAIRNHQIEKFKSLYQVVDVLIIDDIQFLAGKEKTQEEFFYIFNSLYERNKQIVISSDRSPRAIPALTERLRSRFEGGMIADITFPDFETRMAILKAKCQERKVEFSEEILNYIASAIQKNIRQLEGALNILVTYRNLQGVSPDLKVAKSLLKDLTTSTPKALTAKEVIKVVAEFYDLKEKDLMSPSRKKEVVKPRQVAMFLIREELKSSFPFIGRKFGGKDHTTAIYAYEKISKEMEKSENLREEISLIKQRLTGGET